MIGQISGQITHKAERFAIILAGGVGYKVFLTPETLKPLLIKPEIKYTLWTYLAVRENALDLYGFREKSELDFFELLLSVSGIGPKSALAILSIAPPDVLTKAIASGDSSYLTKVSGIGKKSAEKIIVELRDKVGTLETGENLRETGEAIDALQALGYTLREAREALQRVSADISDTGEKVKAALKFLSK